MRTALAILVSCLCISGFGCDVVRYEGTEASCLPRQATNIVDVGNGWCTFDFQGKSFLWHKGYEGHQGYEAITQIK